MYCKNCGRENDSLDKFCAGCGTPLAEVVSSEDADMPVNRDSDNQNEIFYNIVKWIFIIGGIILVICVLVVFYSIFFVYKTENVDLSDVNVSTVYNVIR